MLILLPNTILVLRDNKIAVSGYLLDSNCTLYSVMLVGLNEDGSFTTLFGNHDGKTLTNVYVYAEDFPGAVMQSDGKIIVIDNKPYLPPYDSFATDYLTRFNGYKKEEPLIVSNEIWQGMNLLHSKD